MKIPNPKSPIPNKSQAPNPDAREGKPYDLKLRTFEFACGILDLTEPLPDHGSAKYVKDQLGRAALSVGANVEEADGTLTRKDARTSFIVARKEARETRYWLRVIQRKWRDTPDVREAIVEGTELTKILSSIIEKLG